VSSPLEESFGVHVKMDLRYALGAHPLARRRASLDVQKYVQEVVAETESQYSIST